MECSYCKSSNIIKDIKVGVLNETKSVGLKYTKGIFGYTENFLAELCNDCGSIIRLFVKETNRTWNVVK